MRKPPSIQTSSRRVTNAIHAFTLVELLVVISIIALLVAILLPSLKKARDQAKAVKCGANLHQVGVAFTMYQESFKGVWPPAVDSLGAQNRWPVPFHRGGIVKSELGEYDASGTLISGEDPSMFICPAERAPRRIENWDNGSAPPKTVDRVEVGGSYALNAEFHRDGNVLRLGFVGPPAVPPFIRKIDHCKRPGEIIAVIDNANPIKTASSPGWRFYRDGGGSLWGGDAFYQGWRNKNGEDFTTAPFPVELSRIVGERHSKKSNALFIDTHVEPRLPSRIGYNNVSWDRWDGNQADVPGGVM
ncbi:MAG: hypothetical protein DHS20C16_28590 [Phycisphaerae bacterium]|nr:MAG: hypothetical protein DHS20C16_28590 [Phycisphaerae bacterium]